MKTVFKSLLAASLVASAHVGRIDPVGAQNLVGPAILPPPADAIGGGNPLAGLGRPDDPGPDREKLFGYPTYNSSKFNVEGEQNSHPPGTYSDTWLQQSHSDALSLPSSSSSEANPNLIPARDFNNGNDGVGPTDIFHPVPQNISRFDPTWNRVAPSVVPLGEEARSSLNLPPRLNARSRFDATPGVSSNFRTDRVRHSPDFSRTHSIFENNNYFGMGDDADNWIQSGLITTAAPSEVPGTNDGVLSEAAQGVLSPLSSAVDDMKVGLYPNALDTINMILQADCTNADAHYLKAVVLVETEHFAEAKAEYLMTLKYSHSDALNERVRVGMAKLDK